MFATPKGSSITMAFNEFGEAGRLKASNYYDRIVDVQKGLVLCTVLMRGHAEQLVDRYSRRKSEAAKSDAAND